MGRYDLANEFAAAKEEHDRIRRDREAKEKKEKDAEIAQLREALEWYGPRLRKWQFGSVNESRNALADLRSDAGKRAREALGDD